MSSVVLLAACGGGDAAAGHGPPDETQRPADDPVLGAAVDSEIEGFPRPERLELFSRDAGDRSLDRRVYAPATDAITFQAVSDWYADVLPPGQDFGDWTWCPGSDAPAPPPAPQAVLRRYEHRERGVVQVDLLAVGDPGGPTMTLVQLMSYADGDCSTDVHDLGCLDPGCTVVGLPGQGTSA